MADCVVPTLAATSASVRPASRPRLQHPSRNRIRRPARRTPSLPLVARGHAPEIASDCYSLITLPSICGARSAAPRARGLVFRLLDELVQKDNSLAHYGAVEDPGDSLDRLDSKLEQSAAHCFRMWHSEIWTVDLHSFRVLQEPSDEAAGQGEDLVLDATTMEGDGPSSQYGSAHSLYKESRVQWLQTHRRILYGSAFGRLGGPPPAAATGRALS